MGRLEPRPPDQIRSGCGRDVRGCAGRLVHGRDLCPPGADWGSGAAVCAAGRLARRRYASTAAFRTSTGTACWSRSGPERPAGPLPLDSSTQTTNRPWATSRRGWRPGSAATRLPARPAGTGRRRHARPAVMRTPLCLRRHPAVGCRDDPVPLADRPGRPADDRGPPRPDDDKPAPSARRRSQPTPCCSAPAPNPSGP